MVVRSDRERLLLHLLESRAAREALIELRRGVRSALLEVRISGEPHWGVERRRQRGPALTCVEGYCSVIRIRGKLCIFGEENLLKD